MGIMPRIIAVGLLALNLGSAMCVVISGPDKHGLIPDSSSNALSAPTPGPAVVMGPEAIVVPSGYKDYFSFDTAEDYHHPSEPIKTDQGIDLDHVEASKSVSELSSFVHPTRTGEDTSRPPHSSFTSVVNGPATTIKTISREDDASAYVEYLEVGLSRGPLIPDLPILPRDDYDDGYGYGGSPDTGTTSPVSGGYGSPPESTTLPPGGYGNPPPPAIDKPSIVTVSGPGTVTVTLEFQTSSSVQNVTRTVTASESKSSTFLTATAVTTSTKTQSSTTPVKVNASSSTKSQVYTPISASFSASRTSSSSTPTAHPPPKPITETSQAANYLPRSKPVYLVMAVIAAVLGSWTIVIMVMINWLLANVKDTMRQLREAEEAEEEEEEEDAAIRG
ncbi:hypothetical protein GGR54DRAFT_603837 [Hypoxylon sp. NC1633]|nr:hypothetical protein GGR54DRAFT_603837 [Hypoxylon sp. NC1633]